MKKNDKTLSDIAKTTPKRLLFSPSLFWQQNMGFGIGLITCVFCLLISSNVFFPYSAEELNRLVNQGSMDFITVILYVCIYFFAFIGLCIAIYTVAKIQVETAIAQKIFTKSNAQLREIRRTGRRKVNLSELETMIPKNTGFEAAMIRLFTLIFNEAKDRRFESSVILMSPYRDESNGDIFQTSIFQKIVLQLGILGTFIGLINAFNDLNLGELETSLSNISAALKYAFSTSIAGLIAAILLGVILFFLKRKQESYFKIMEKASSQFISLARNSLNPDAYLNSLKALGHQVEQSNQQTNRLKGEVAAQTSVLSEGMQELKKTKEEFHSFLQEIEAVEAKFMEKVSKVYETLSPEKISQELKESLEKATQAYLNETKQKYEDLNQLIEQTNQNLGKMDAQLEKQVNHLGKTTKSQQEFIDKVTGNHITNQLVNVMTNTSNKLTETLEGKINNFIHHFTKFQEAFETFNSSTIDKHRRGIFIMGVIVAFTLFAFGLSMYPHIISLLK